MAKKLTKKEAVRQALSVLGNDAMPLAIQDWVRAHLAVEMTTAHISTTKGELLREKARANNLVNPVPEPPAPVAPPPVEPVKKPTRGKVGRPAGVKKTAPTPPALTTGILVEDVFLLQGLVRRVEPDALKTLIDAFARR
jgi:hypothetical protein